MPRKIAFIRIHSVPYTNESVAQLFRELYPEFEIEIIDLLEDFLKSRKDVTLVNIFYVIKEYGFDILLGKKKWRRAFFITTYLFRKIKEWMAQRLSENSYVFSFQMQSLFDASVEGIPHFVYTDHTVLANLYYPYVDLNKELYPQQWIELEKTIYQNATMVFTRSTNIAKSVVEHYSIPPDKVLCVYAGGNANVNYVELDNDNYCNKNILFVGLDWKRKGGPQLVEAFKCVLKVHPDAYLTIVGSSPPVSVPNCDVVGQVPLEEVHRYFRKATVFCLPTSLEPFGIVFVEALAHKLPIVATNIGAIPDFVTHGENGYLIESKNVAQIAEALIVLVGNPGKCRTFGKKGYQLVKQRYSWEKVGTLMKDSIAWHLSVD